jgi:DNA (cytosine-5)-methyltransferase 3A
LNILSLFDGVSCGQVASIKAGLKINNYYASEIKDYAIKVTMKNFPETIQLGDITLLNEEKLNELDKIDLIIGGSPCQDLSVYKFDRGEVTGLNGEKSGLFYHYARILKYIKPKYFLLENVPMQKNWKDLITKILGVEPIMINSNLVSGADRKRLYWTNIPNVTQPKDKEIMLQDIIQKADDVPLKYWYKKDFIYNGDDKKVQCTLNIHGHRNMKEVYNLKGKCNTLLADGDGGHRQKKVYQDGKCRKLTPLEYERLMNLPDNYTENVCDSSRYSAVGNGWTIDVIKHIFSFIR